MSERAGVDLRVAAAGIEHVEADEEVGVGLRARAAVKGVDMSRFTTVAPIDVAVATLSSVEPEST